MKSKERMWYQLIDGGVSGILAISLITRGQNKFLDL